MTEDFLWYHEWITETKVTMRDKPHHGGTELRQRSAMSSSVGFVRFSAPTNFNSKFVNIGTKVVKFRDTVNSAIELMCRVVFDWTHTPRECFLRAVTIMLSYAPDTDLDLKEEMQGWGVGDDRIARLSEIRASVIRAMSDAGIH